MSRPIPESIWDRKPADCRRALLTASALADGEESPRSALQLHRHLQNCHPCSCQVQEMGRLLTALTDLTEMTVEPGIESDPATAEHLLARIRDRLPLDPRPVSSRRRNHHLRLVSILLGAGTLFLGLGRSAAWLTEKSIPPDWVFPLPRILFEKALETLTVLARVAAESLGWLLFNPPEMPLPIPGPVLGTSLLSIFFGLLLPCIALLAMMTHLFWRDIVACLGAPERRRV